MTKMNVNVLYTSGLEMSYETQVTNEEQLSGFLDLIQDVYNGANAGYIRLPNEKDGEVVFIDLKNTMSIRVINEDLFNK